MARNNTRRRWRKQKLFMCLALALAFLIGGGSLALTGDNGRVAAATITPDFKAAYWGDNYEWQQNSTVELKQNFATITYTGNTIEVKTGGLNGSPSVMGTGNIEIYITNKPNYSRYTIGEYKDGNGEDLEYMYADYDITFYVANTIINSNNTYVLNLTEKIGAEDDDEVYDYFGLGKTLYMGVVFKVGNTHYTSFENNTNINYKAFNYAPVFELPPDPSKTGYTFDYWCLDEALTQPYDGRPIYEDTSLYAKFTPINYTVTYNTNGGDSITTKNYNIETATFSLPTPTKTGYTFDGWYANSGLTGTKVTQVAKGSTGNKTYYAKWKTTNYTISYNTNGGAAIEPINYTIESNNITLPTPTKSGYTFGGWFDNSSLTGTAVTQVAKGSTGNKTFYAKWTPTNYTITYNVNGGSSVSNSNYNIETNTITLPTSTRDGYSFEGWYTASDFSGSKVTQIPKGSTGNKVYYAKWSEVTYTIAYNVNGGSDIENGSYKVTTATFSLPTPTRNGYTFGGWFENSGLTGTAVAQIVKGSFGNKTYYAKWTIINYTITYNVNGGSTVNNSNYNVAAATITLPTTTREGYTFGGWFVSSDFSGNAVATIDTGSTGNKTFYAKWNTINYTINYNVNGGTAINTGNYNIETSTITLPTAVKSGYTFGGWFVSEDFSGNAVTQVAKGSIGNKTFYAKWTVTTYTITYNTNSGEIAGAIEEYNILSSEVTLTEPTRFGYAFLGWYDNAGFTGSLVTTIPTGSTGNKTFYAKWEGIVCKVTFIVDGEVYEVMDLPYGTSFASVPEIEVLMLASSEFISPSNYVNGEMTVYAKLDPALEPYINFGNKMIRLKEWLKSYWWVLMLGGAAATAAVVYFLKKK